MEEVLLAATKLNRNGIVTKLAAAGADVNTTQCDPRPDAPPKPHAGSAVAGLYAGLGYSPDHPLHTRHVAVLAADGDSMLHVAAKLGYKLTMQKLLRVRRRPGALPLAARRRSPLAACARAVHLAHAMLRLSDSAAARLPCLPGGRARGACRAVRLHAASQCCDLRQAQACDRAPQRRRPAGSQARWCGPAPAHKLAPVPFPFRLRARARAADLRAGPQAARRPCTTQQ